MIYLLYDILLHIAIVILIPYFLVKMVTVRKYREGILERFGFIDPAKAKGLSGGPVIWVHAVSVGEAKAAVPVMRLLKSSRPDLRIVFSTTTKTGNRTAAKDCAGLIDALFYFPLDLSWAIKRVVRLFRPRAFVAVEKEVWPNLYNVMSGSGIPVVIINGTISDRSFRRFSSLNFFFKGVFRKISCFCARTEDDLKKALSLGIAPSRALNAGNVKFDISPPPSDSARAESLKSALGLIGDRLVFVAGSTHAGEEEIVLNAFKCLVQEVRGVKLILAPRHPERFSEVEAQIKRTGLSYSRRTENTGSGEIVLLDTVGELMLAYSFATVAFVGGSIVPGVGGHNLLEPAFYGKPVLYGSHLTAYLNMAELLEGAGGGIRVRDELGLLGALKRLFSDPGLSASMGQRAKRAVEDNRGAAKRCVEVIEGFLK